MENRQIRKQLGRKSSSFKLTETCCREDIEKNKSQEVSTRMLWHVFYILPLTRTYSCCFDSFPVIYMVHCTHRFDASEGGIKTDQLAALSYFVYAGFTADVPPSCQRALCAPSCDSYCGSPRSAYFTLSAASRLQHPPVLVCDPVTVRPSLHTHTPACHSRQHHLRPQAREPGSHPPPLCSMLVREPYPAWPDGSEGGGRIECGK